MMLHALSCMFHCECYRQTDVYSSMPVVMFTASAVLLCYIECQLVSHSRIMLEVVNACNVIGFGLMHDRSVLLLKADITGVLVQPKLSSSLRIPVVLCAES